MSKVLVFSHQKGGVGKTTIAIQVAVELSKTRNVEYIDLDSQKLFTVFAKIRTDRLGDKLNGLEISSPGELKDAINNAKDILIIDVTGADTEINRYALLGADMIITPVSNSMIELYGLQKFKMVIEQLQELKPNLKAHILLNNINPSAKRIVDDLKSYFNQNKKYFGFIQAVVRRRAVYQSSFENGKSVVELEKKLPEEKRKASKEINKLIEKILEKVQ